MCVDEDKALVPGLHPPGVPLRAGRAGMQLSRRGEASFLRADREALLGLLNIAGSGNFQSLRCDWIDDSIPQENNKGLAGPGESSRTIKSIDQETGGASS